MAESANEIMGRNVRRLREGRQLTQEDLAHMSGLHAPAVGRVERAAADSRVSTVERLAEALGVSVASLFEP